MKNINLLVTEVDEGELVVEIHWFVRDAVRERGSTTVHPADLTNTKKFMRF